MSLQSVNLAMTRQAGSPNAWSSRQLPPCVSLIRRKKRCSVLSCGSNCGLAPAKKCVSHHDDRGPGTFENVRRIERRQHSAATTANSTTSTTSMSGNTGRDREPPPHLPQVRARGRCPKLLNPDISSRPEFTARYEQHGTSLGAPSRALRTC
eukprot:7098396-Prymnesium_polylepis.1